MADTTGAGHGGKNNFDVGAVGNGTTEHKEVVEINNYFRKTNPNWVDVSDRSATTVIGNLQNIVNNTNRVGNANERTLSHHMNAFNGKATGVEVWYYAGDELMRRKATELSAAIAKALGLVDRGAKATTSLYVVSNTLPHCLLIEWCFVDNPNDMKAWRANKFKAMDAAMKVLGMKVGSGTPTTPPAPKPQRTRHIVVTGWYAKNGQSHKNLIVWLKAKGMAYTEVVKKERVWVYCIFNQESSWKRELEDYLVKQSWNYVVVLEGQQNTIINNW